MENKSIIIFTDKYPYSRSEHFFEEELKYIAASFEKVTILPLEKGNSDILRKIPDNVDLIAPVFNFVKGKEELLAKGIFNRSAIFPFFREFIKRRVWRSHFTIYNWCTHLLLMRALLSHIRKENLMERFKEYDVLYFYWGVRWSQILPFFPKRNNFRVVVRFHGSDLYEHTNHNYVPFRKKQLKRINLAIFISEMGQKYMLQRYPIITEKCEIARMGTLDHGLNNYQKGKEIHLISCSNVVAVKRVSHIVRSLHHITAPVKWTHIGGGPLMQELKTISNMLPSNVNVELTGTISHDQLIEYYQKNSVDVFINVSSSEGIPVSVMEAMSFGIPVIATDVGGTHEVVNEDSGYLVDPKISAQDLASKIQEMVSRPDYESLRHSARKQWENICMADKVYPEFIQKLKAL
jgi:colanic acid/amylovoran biosynthesis glycosyltransferase